MRTSSTKFLYSIGIVNLLIVAIYGTLMRYKIAFDFPFFDQKNLLHAHSHFAFSGWISNFLYTGLALLITPFISQQKAQKYQRLILFNLLCAFGMLIAFTISGYKIVSITFSTLSILVAILFAISFIKDAAQFPKGHPSKPWAIAGLVFNVLSSFGPLNLAYILMSKSLNHEFYLGSVYYYLHFQYSGWFFFAAMAIALSRINSNLPLLKKHFWVLTTTTIITFCLSILWAKPPMWLYTITVIATIVQLFTWFSLVTKFGRPLLNENNHSNNPLIRILLFGAFIAVSFKFILQTISVIPHLSQLVFGIRPIVIAYLHLVMLGVYSLFIISNLFANKWLPLNKSAKIGAGLFIIGVALNELFLAVQGLAAFKYIPIPFINELLLFAAILLLLSAIILVASLSNKSASS